MGRERFKGGGGGKKVCNVQSNNSNCNCILQCTVLKDVKTNCKIKYLQSAAISHLQTNVNPVDDKNNFRIERKLSTVFICALMFPWLLAWFVNYCKSSPGMSRMLGKLSKHPLMQC